MSFTPLSLPWVGGDGNTSEEISCISGELKGNHILTPVLTPNESAIADQINVATTLARATGGTLHVTHPLSIADQPPMDFRYRVTDDTAHEPLDRVLDRIDETTAHGDGGVRYNQRLIKGILRTITTHDIDTLILPRDFPGGVLRREVTNQLAAHISCDVIVVNGRSGYDTVASILLPIAGGRHSGLAADVSRRIAQDCDAWVDILHVVEEDASVQRRERAQEYVNTAYQRIARPETTSTWILTRDDIIETIIEQSKYYELLILGAPTTNRLAQFVYGSTNRSIRTNAWSVVLSARNNTIAYPPSRN